MLAIYIFIHYSILILLARTRPLPKHVAYLLWLYVWDIFLSIKHEHRFYTCNIQLSELIVRPFRMKWDIMKICFSCRSISYFSFFLTLKPYSSLPDCLQFNAWLVIARANLLFTSLSYSLVNFVLFVAASS